MNETKHKGSESEIEELKFQIENFEKEKERVRSIVGQIGGVPTFTKKFYEILFIILVIASLGAALLLHGILRIASIEMAIALLSIKIIYLMRNQSRVNHFQLWILTSLEWRITELFDKVENANSKNNSRQSTQ